LDDLKRRAAAALNVGYRQISILSGERCLEGKDSISAALGDEDPTQLSVLVVAAAKVYKSDVNRAYQEVGFLKQQPITFPPPTDINVNMLPFKLGKKESLPAYLQGYWPLISACRVQDEELGKVGYLTVQEGHVEKGSAQRRPGLHTEAPGVVLSKGRVVSILAKWGHGRGFRGGPKQSRRAPRRTLEEFIAEAEAQGSEPNYDEFDFEDELDDEDSSFCWTANVTQGGIYTASTVARSTRAWDMRFAQLSDIAGPLGDLEHVRTLLGAGTELDANTLYWLTDATPHESMVLEESTYRQYFRLVTSEVSIWYSAHSSENPKGVRPDPKVTQVVAHDKFLDLARQARLLEESDLRKDEVWDLHAKERGLGTEGEEIDALLDRLKLDIR